MTNNTSTKSLHVGVLAIIGSFAEHENLTARAAKKMNGTQGHIFNDVSVEISVIRKPEEVNELLDALIIPGGETTVLSSFLAINGFVELLKDWTSKPEKFTWGTCAGLIILSNDIKGGGRKSPASIGGIGITCLRNAYGRQNESHVADLKVESKELLNVLSFDKDHTPAQSYPGVFIRAPLIKSIDSGDVEVLCVKPHALRVGGTIQADMSMQPVAVAHGNKMATTFHPELTDDVRFHAFFLQQALERKYSKLVGT